MKNPFVAVILVFALFISGCSSFQKAQTVYNIIGAAISVAQADLPALQAAGAFSVNDATIAAAYLGFASNLNAQYGNCITNAQSTTLKNSGKFLACVNIFSAGLADPKELAGLRVMSNGAQQKTQLWIVAIQLGLNAGFTAFGSMQPQTPVISPTVPAPTVAELHEFARHAGVAYGF